MSSTVRDCRGTGESLVAWNETSSGRPRPVQAGCERSVIVTDGWSCALAGVVITGIPDSATSRTMG